MPKIDILQNPTGAINFLRKLLNRHAEDAVEKAVDIATQEYNNFLDEAGQKGISGILNGVRFEIDSFGSGKNKRFSISVPEESVGPNLVFNVLDQGVEKPLGAATAHGLKAWPIHNPRSEAYEGQNMTTENSMLLKQAVSESDIIYRPFIFNKIEPRHFTEHIADKINDRLRDEGLDKFIRVKVSEI